MINYDSYIKQLNAYEWHFEENVADHLKRRGYPASHSPFIRAALKELVEREDGPLSGIEPLQHDAYEMMIIMGVVDNLITKYL